MELNAIISSCHNRSIKDQKTLYEYTYQKLFHVSLRYTNSGHDAEEVFNLAILKIFRHIIEDQSEIKNYLGFCTNIIRLTAIDQYRSKLSPVLYNTDVLYENNQDLYFDNAFNNLDVEDIFKFIQNLPDKERIVFSMFEIDGFSHREIGNLKQAEASSSKKTTAKKSSGSSTHTVGRGDTLYGIALKNKTTVAKIKAANGLKSDLIRPGQKLKLR